MCACMQSSCYGHVCAVRVAGFRTSNVEYRWSAALRMCGLEYCVWARVHVRDHVCVHACSCYGHVSASVALPQSSQVTDAVQNTQLSSHCSVRPGSGSVSMTCSQHLRTHPITPRMLSGIVRLQLVHRESRLVRLRPLKSRFGTAQPPIIAGSAYVRR